MKVPSAEEKAHEFLKVSELYRLGQLPTESSHPMTVHLSDWAQSDLSRAIEVLKQIDLQALNRLLEKMTDLSQLQEEVKNTFAQGGRVFLCGCGATGRLALSLECLWRELHPSSDQVISFMAGGDVALVHSLEGFEDYPEYGAKHLRQMGFSEEDLLISCTEGGETPYVIGATEEALKISSRPPYFLYCNPDDVLCERVERSRQVIENSKIKKINLFVGPMALAGSTRMQASTVLHLAVGMALFFPTEEIMSYQLRYFIDSLIQMDFSEIAPFILSESEIYNKKEDLVYAVNDFAITVFTDTTERAPTFSLAPFHPQEVSAGQPLSLCYISLPQAQSSKAAWAELLGRAPRALNWDQEKTKEKYLESFNFSDEAKKIRQKLFPGHQHEFQIFKKDQTVHWKLDDLESEWNLDNNEHPLFHHILLKLTLNIHSTLIMGRLGRYKHNLMTWVNPSNGKLIDRASRYVTQLLKDDGLAVPYEKVVLQLYRELESIEPTESIVLKTYEALK